MLKKHQYNLVVIGGGSAGLIASYMATHLKAKVALIEKNKMGGDCLNTGCIPSKSLIKSAKIFSTLNHLEKFGFESINTKKIHFEFEKVMEKIHRNIAEIAPHDSTERYQSLGVDCFIGEAEILCSQKVRVNQKILSTRSIIIASGASPIIPKIKGIEQIPFLTSNTLWSLTRQPKKLIVMGGGAIGVEIAQSFARLNTEVIIIEMQEKILAREDTEVSDFLTNQLKKEGVRVLTSHQVIEIQKNKIILKRNSDKLKNDTIEISFNTQCDNLFLALGRKANTQNLGLENIAIKLNENGFIQTNDYLQTNVKNIFACGDITGKSQFTHSASNEAYFACINALFAPFKKFKLDNLVMPYAVFSDPEIARVGLNEKQAREKGIAFQIHNLSFEQNNRAITDDCKDGFIKLITAKNSDKILGVSIVGTNACELIAEFVLAMKNKLGANKILSTIHIYPTLSETNKFVAAMRFKQKVSQKGLIFLQKFHHLMRKYF